MALTPYQQLQQVKDHYNSIGQHFAETRKKKMQLELVEFAKMVKPGMRVLDVGCGSGRLLTELAGKKVYYTGLDFSSTLIKQAQKRYPKRRFKVADVTNPDSWKGIGKFDAVFCLGVMHHIPDRKRQHGILQNMFRHTKSGGMVVISVWNLWQSRFWKKHLSQWKKKIEYGNFSFIWVPYSVSDGRNIVKRVNRFCKAYFPGELLRLVKQVGFQVEVWHYAKRGEIKLSMSEGENFVIMGRRK